MLVRISTGSAICLGLDGGVLDVKPTTAYLLTYRPGRCSANCAFCPQARGATSELDMLSRVVWPPYPIKTVTHGLREAAKEGNIKRVCIQALNYPTVFNDILKIVADIKASTNIPISVSCQPLVGGQIRELAEVGLDRIGIPLDAATEKCFDKIKGLGVGGPYTWRGHFKALRTALKFFGVGRVSTHLMVGLGENEEEIISIIEKLNDMGVYPGLFALTPIPGTLMERDPQPSLEGYRRIQLAHYLITNRMIRTDKIGFNEEGTIISFGINHKDLKNIVRSGKPFLTTGCPNCNRPYYNERPGGPIYNYPRSLNNEEIKEIEKQVRLEGKKDD